MRGILLAVCFAVASCAANLDDSRYFYQGVYAPGSASISDDGGFVSSASVWADENMEIARQAAIFRLQKAAETRGYSYALLAGAGASKPFGHQYKMEGVLYPEGSLPQGAIPLAMLESNLLTGPPVDIQPAATVERTKLDNRRRNGHPKGKDVELAEVSIDCQMSDCNKVAISKDSTLNCNTPLRPAKAASETVDKEYIELLRERQDDAPAEVLQWTLRPGISE